MRRRRRGIGTVIASAIMIFLMVFAVAQLFIYNIDELDNYNRVADKVFATEAQKLQEHLSIQSVTLDTSGGVSQDILATLVISNTGGVTSQIVDVWFDNAGASTALHTVVQESNVFVGRGLSVTLQSLDTGIAYNSNAQIKVSVITALGNSVSVQLLPPGLAGTTAQTLASVSLIVNPPNPITTNDISVLLTVTNNNALGVAFTNITPDICLVEGNVAPSASTCQTALIQCADLSFPVTCSQVSQVTPASVSYLPYGSTAVFQWIYLLNSITADKQITIMASYASLSTTSFASASQTPYQSITIRSAGGASSNSGGNFLNAIGSLVNYFNSFQASQSSGVWVVGIALTAGAATAFRMNITNLSPNVIQFNSNTELLVVNTKTGTIYEFYIVQACTNYQPYYSSSTTCVPNSFPANGYIVAPAQTITMYFAATIVGGATEQKLGSSGQSGTSWPATVAFFGYKFPGAGVTQPAGTTTSQQSLVTAMTGSTFSVIVQAGWNTGTVQVCTYAGSCTGAPSGTPTLGTTVITGVSVATYGTGFTLKFQNAPPASTSCIASGYASNQCNTFAYGVYNSDNTLNYAQASTIYAVRTI